MAQVLPQLQSGFGQQLRESLSRATDFYLQNKQEQKKVNARKILADPTSTAEAKKNAILEAGSIEDFLKYETQQKTDAAVGAYNKARSGMTSEGNQPRLNRPAQLSDQDVGGQANEDFLGVDTNNAPSVKSPSAPSQILQKPDENEIDEDAIDRALAMATQVNPALGSGLTKIETSRRTSSTANQKAIDRSYELTEPYRSSVTEELENSEKALSIVDRILEISDDVDSTPTFVALMQKLGVPASVFGNPTEEELEKDAGELAKNIPSGWKGKILASEFHVLLRTIPGLINTPEGRKLIGRNMKLLFAAPKIKFDAMREVTDEYLEAGKKLPANFREKIYDRMKPAMDFLHKEFVKGSDEALSYAERLEKGGTSRNETAQGQPKLSKEVQQKISKLKPIQAGFVRFVSPNGEAFDIPEDQAHLALEADPKLQKVS